MIFLHDGLTYNQIITGCPNEPKITKYDNTTMCPTIGRQCPNVIVRQ